MWINHKETQNNQQKDAISSFRHLCSIYLIYNIQYILATNQGLNLSHPCCHSKILNLGENFLVQEEVIVRFTPTTASQPLIKGFISFPHCVSRAWRSLTVWDCFVNADTVRCAKFFLFFLAACMGQVILVTFSWPIGTLLPSSISKTIRLLFCSSDTCHPVSSQSTYFFPPRCSCSTKENAWGLLAIVYQPASYLFSLPFFLSRNKIPLEPGKNS